MIHRARQDRPGSPVRGAEQICVIGDGALGAALALVLARGGHVVRFHMPDPGAPQRVLHREAEFRSLGVVEMGRVLSLACPDAVDALRDAKTIFLAVPARRMGAILRGIPGVLEPGVGLVLASSAFLAGGATPSQLAGSIVPGARVSTFLGSSFACLVLGGGGLASVAVASADAAAAQRVAGLFSEERGRLRCQVLTDVRGAEIGGALQDLYAAFLGLADGFTQVCRGSFERGTGGALTSECLGELVRLGTGLGAALEALLGPSGAGGMVAAAVSRCGSYPVGHELALRSLGLAPPDPRRERGADLRDSLGAVRQAAARLHPVVPTPILDATFQVLVEGAPIGRELERLLSAITRPPTRAGVGGDPGGAGVWDRQA